MSERTCLFCRKARSKSSLLRFVASSGALKADPAGVLPGRGAYLCRTRECVEGGLKRAGAFARALRTKAAVPDAAGVEKIIREAGL